MGSSSVLYWGMANHCDRETEKERKKELLTRLLDIEKAKRRDQGKAKKALIGSPACD
jgi:hypothetical protein